MQIETTLGPMLESVLPHLDERSRRLVAAAEARRLGHGGITLVSRLSGLSRVTLTKGIKELDAPPLEAGRIRKRNAGRKRVGHKDAAFAETLGSLLRDSTRGDPQSPLRWTCKSTRALSREMKRLNHGASHETIAAVLRRDGYSLQASRKTGEGADHPDRDAQFRHISRRVKRAIALGQPVISVDTKKKELLGNHKNNGQQWRKHGTAPRVNGHDFPGPDVPRAYPYGIYDIGRNKGFVNIGTGHDTGAFACASILGWWEHEGRAAYPDAKWLLVTADGGGSNGWRSRLWKRGLHKLSAALGLPVRVCHFPPGTSKWNAIGHRLFSFITSNWRGEALRDYETVVRLIGATKTVKGLTVSCRLDHSKYPTGETVSQEEMDSIPLARMRFHGEWNYIIRSQKE